MDSKCTEEQLNCKKHHFKHEGGAEIICQECGVHIIDLIDGQHIVIQQQAKRIAELEDDNGQQHIEIMLLSRKNKQQEREAELGRLAVEVMEKIDEVDENTLPCDFQANRAGKNKNITCSKCSWQQLCQLREQLLVEEGNGDA